MLPFFNNQYHPPPAPHHDPPAPPRHSLKPDPAAGQPASGSARATTGSGTVERVPPAQPASTQSSVPPATAAPRWDQRGSIRPKAGSSSSRNAPNEPTNRSGYPSPPPRQCDK